MRMCLREYLEGEYLVTGDKDLLIIEKYEGVKIIDPRRFELLFD